MSPLIRPEDQVAQDMVPPLDPSLLHLNYTEKEFLRAAISEDEDEMRRRILEVQHEAYEKYPYPCIRAFHYVSLFMCRNPAYPKVVQAGKTGKALFLDLGCCMGTDVRKLAHDGYPAENIFATDVRPEYLLLGYQLFQDEDRTPIHFFASDIFNVPPAFRSPFTLSIDPGELRELAQLTSTLTHVYVGALFHLFDEGTQEQIALRITALLKREPGAIVFGRHSGMEKEGLIDDHLGRTRYGHSPASWEKMWRQVFVQAEEKEFAENRVKIDAKLEKFDYALSRGESTLVWSVEIV